MALSLWALSTAAMPVAAQSNAITVSAGFASAPSPGLPAVGAAAGTLFSAGAGAAGGITWNRVFYRHDAIAFASDLSFALAGSASTRIGGSSFAGVQQGALLLAPGVQTKLFPGARVAPFVTLGAGLASLGSIGAGFGGGAAFGGLRQSNQIGVGVAAGADIRVVRFFHLRPEYRRYSPLDGVGMFLLGAGFHF